MVERRRERERGGEKESKTTGEEVGRRVKREREKRDGIEKEEKRKEKERGRQRGGEREGGDRETGRSIAWKALRAHWSEEEVGGEDKMEVGNKEKGRATEIKRAVRDEEDEERLQTRERVGGRARKSGRVRFAASGSGGTDTPRDVQ